MNIIAYMSSTHVSIDLHYIPYWYTETIKNTSSDCQKSVKILFEIVSLLAIQELFAEKQVLMDKINIILYSMLHHSVLHTIYYH